MVTGSVPDRYSIGRDRSVTLRQRDCCIAQNALLPCNIVCIKSGQLSYSQIRNFRQRHLLPALSKRMASSPPRRPSITNETHRTSSRGGFCCFKPRSHLQQLTCRINARRRPDADRRRRRCIAKMGLLRGRLCCSRGGRLTQAGLLGGSCALCQGFGWRDKMRILGR